MRSFGLSIIMALTVLLALPSCLNRKAAEAMSLAETVMESAPDSALSVLESIDTLSLGSKAQRARFSLLYSMALDKNYIDTADTRLIMPAVSYYSRHGFPDDRMKSLYYLGRVQYNAGDVKRAIVSLDKARELFDLSEDKVMCGLVCGALADLYGDNHLAEEQLAALEKGFGFFEEAKDERRSNLIIGRLANAYHDLHKWAEADSLYKEALTKNVKDTFAMRVFLSNYAIMKIIQPKPDYEGSIELFNRLSLDYGKHLDSQELSCFAFAQELAGNDHLCDEILTNCEGVDEFWEYKILQHRKQYEEAIDCLNKTYVVQDSVIRMTLRTSVYDSMKDYYAEEARIAHQKIIVGRFLLSIVILSCLVLLLIIVVVFMTKFKRECEDRKRVEALLENASTLLVDSKAEYQRNLSNLHDSYTKLYREQFVSLKSLCTLYLSTRKLDSRKDRIYAEVESILSFINGDDKKWKSFECRINKSLDNIVAKLRQELPGLSEVDVRLFCYFIIKIDAETISTITGLTTSNIYSHKSRLKDKIISMNPTHKDEFLLFF